MSSPAQVAANQANSRKSTGPRTEATKAITRKNASRHGLCSTLPTDCREDLDAPQTLLADLMAEHQPQGPTEEILVYKMAEQFQFSKRASEYLSHHMPASTDQDAKMVALYLRYYSAADRAFNRNLKDLQKLQKQRAEQEAQPEIGFVSENAQPASHDPAPLSESAPATLPIVLVEAVAMVNAASEAVIIPRATQKQAA